MWCKCFWCIGVLYKPTSLPLLQIKLSFSSHTDLAQQRLKVFLKRSTFILGNRRNQTNDLFFARNTPLHDQEFVSFYTCIVIFHSKKVVLLCSGLCFQQCYSNSGVCSDFTEFSRSVGHVGGREREWRKEDTFLFVPSKLYAFSITLQKYYCKTVI